MKLKKTIKKKFKKKVYLYKKLKYIIKYILWEIKAYDIFFNIKELIKVYKKKIELL